MGGFGTPWSSATRQRMDNAVRSMADKHFTNNSPYAPSAPAAPAPAPYAPAPAPAPAQASVNAPYAPTAASFAGPNAFQLGAPTAAPASAPMTQTEINAIGNNLLATMRDVQKQTQDTVWAPPAAKPGPNAAQLGSYTNFSQPDSYNPADFSAAIAKTGADTAAELAAFLKTLGPATTTNDPAVDGPATTTEVPATTTEVPATTEIPVVDPAPYVPPYVPPANLDPANLHRPTDLADQIRALMGELTTTDQSQSIRNMIGDRRVDVGLAETRRGSQIDEIARQLGVDVGALETGRLEQQKALIDAVAGRASGLTGGVADRLATARADLGPQVTDEFEQVAQLVGGQAGSQAASSQDAMARLAQVANMASAERAAAPDQLAAESKLALGDEAFQMLQGLGQEETQRLLSESMRQEEFNTQRDEAMIGALLGDMGRREDFLTREAERLQGQAFQSDEQAMQRLWQGQQAGAQRDWQTDERVAGQTWQGDQAADQRKWQGEQAVDERAWREGESLLDRSMRISEAELGRDLQRDQIAESSRQRGLDRKAQTDSATTNFQRQQQQIREANTEQDRVRLANSAAESAAATAVAAGSAEAASYFLGIRDAEGNPTTEGAAIWDSMSEAAKTNAYQQMIADENTQGTRWNAGSYANMVGKYGQNNSDHILHAEHMVGMNEAQRKGYLEQLQTESMMSSAAMDANDIKKIELFYTEIDAANKAQQASNRIAAETALESSIGALGLEQGDLLGGRTGSDFNRGPDEQRIWGLKERERLRTGASGTGDKFGYASPTTTGPRS